MNINDGTLLPFSAVEKLSKEDQQKYIEVKRDLTRLEELNKQIQMYSPCGCGSGKKFKFCCYKGDNT